MDTNYQTIEQFYENLSVFIEANEFLKNFKFEIFVLKEKVDNKLMLEIINSIDSIDTSMEKKPSWSFMLFINIMLRNGKGEVMTSPGINKLISRLLKNKNMEELYDPTIGTGMLAVDTSTEVQASKVLTCFTDKNIEDITKTYNERNEIGGFSRRVSMDEIAENGFNLNVQRYIEAKDEKEELDIDAIGREINMLIVKLRGTQENIEKILKKENY